MKVNGYPRKLILILPLLLVILTSACTAPENATSTPTNPIATESTQVLVPTQATPATQTPEQSSSELVACSPYLCANPEFWKLGSNGPESLPLAIAPGVSYDATATTGRVLYKTKSPDQGVGPGNLSVGDLWWLDVRSGQTRAIFTDENVVEAACAPDGQNFAYVRATPETYELHWYTATGEDKLLAKDVAFTFSVSPAGNQVAFTRESNYNIGGTPGLYVVDIASGQERQISTVDRAGMGSVADQPIWSPDGSHILLPVASDVNTWIVAATDGSQTTQLNFSPEVTTALNNYSVGFVLWHPDGIHLVGSSFPGMQGGPSKVMLFSLNPALDTVISAKVLREDDSIVVGWNKPGESLWVRTMDGKLEDVPVE